MAKFSLFSSLRKASLTKKLWFAGSALGLFLLVIVIGNQFIARDKAVTRAMLGHDFLAFYTAGSFVREGRYRDLYNLDAVKDFEGKTSKAAGLEVGKSFGPWWNPPFYALVFEPLAGMPYPVALDTWRWINLAAVIAAMGLLAGIVARERRIHHGGTEITEREEEEKDSNTDIYLSPSSPLRDLRASVVNRMPNWGLVPLLILISMPFVQSFSHGQNTFTSLLLLTVTVMLWRTERRFLAGLVGGLLFYKPQLAAVIAIVMVVDLGWRALTGFLVTGITLLLVTFVAIPGSLGDFIHLLPANVHWMQVEHSYLWERHVTLKAFWRLLLQGREAGEASWLTCVLSYGSVGVAGIGLGWAILRGRFASARGYHPRLYNSNVRRDRLIAATIAVMPLLMPFYFDYDLLLLAVPVTLYAAERVQHPHLVRTNDRWLVRTWIALFFWLFFNPAVALHSHVNVTVLLLAGVAGQLIWRAGRVEVATSMSHRTQTDYQIPIAA